MKDADYIYAVACIRTKEKSLLKDSDIQTISGLSTEGAVITYLIERGWGNNDTKDAEKLLAVEETKTAEVLGELGVGENIIDILMFREYFHNLKTAVKQVCTDDADDPRAFYESSRFNGEKLKTIIRDNAFQELPSYMSKAAETAKDVMLTARDGQRCDSIVDRACLEAMISEAHKTRDSFLIDYAESKVATADIKIAVRGCSTKKSYDFILEALCPCKAFDVKKLAKAAASGKEELLGFLSHTEYSEAAEAINESFSSFEKWCDDVMIKKIMSQKTNIQSVGPVVAYYLARQNEIRMVRIILTAKANGFPDRIISERVRKMYG
jgi:Archaeal/vacuolar-type H+-ATPase subunit C